MTYSPHPAAELIPPMTDLEFSELRASIKTKGLETTITLYEDKILDGRHRYRACTELGVEPVFVEYEGSDPVGFVTSLNLDRRHLTTGQRSMAALALLDYEKGRAKERQGKRTDLESTSASDEAEVHSEVRATKLAGEKFGVSRSSVERARTVAEERPDLAEKVKAGELTVAAAHDEAKGKPKAPPRPLDVSSTRNRQVAEKAMGRLQNIVSRLEGYAQGAPNIRLDHVFAVATADDLAYWHKSLADSRSELHTLQKAIKQEVDNRDKA